MPRWPTGRPLLLALVLVALLPRLGLLAVVGTRGLEAWEYESLAKSIAAGQGYVIARFGHLAYAFGDGNLYSFLGAAVYMAAGHQPMLLALVQAVLASLATPVIYSLGAPILGRRSALVGALLSALHPGLLAYSLKLHALNLDVLLLVLLVLMLMSVDQRPRTGVRAGVALGLNLMTRPTFFLAGALALVVRWLMGRAGFRAGFVAALIALLIVSPWIARNWAVVGQPVIVSTGFEDVWKGNNPLASGSAHLASGEDLMAVAPPELRARLNSSTEMELNEIFTAEVLSFVQTHPDQFAVLTIKKFVYFWTFSPQTGLLYPSEWLLPYQMYYVVIASLGILGAVRILKEKDKRATELLVTLAVVSLVIASIHALAYVEGRHRWGIEPLLLLLTGHGALYVWDWWRRFRARQQPAMG